MSTLYVIGTPIGNLEDMTLRAIRILGEVDLILCEDTRVTKTLLAKYGIARPTMSYHSQSKLSKIDIIIGMLRDGNDLALVSDAGTPTISDPGSLLVSKVREALPEASIVAIPGPSALTSALSISGLPASEFLFLGFLPHKKGRETLFKEIGASERTVVFYESPHRILKSIESLTKYASGRHIVIARELSKMYEEIISGTPLETATYFASHPDKVRGEFVVMVSGR